MPGCSSGGRLGWPDRVVPRRRSRRRLAKTAANLAAKLVCDEAMQIHGGYGYSREYPVERAATGDLVACVTGPARWRPRRLSIGAAVSREIHQLAGVAGPEPRADGRVSLCRASRQRHFQTGGRLSARAARASAVSSKVASLAV